MSTVRCKVAQYCVNKKLQELKSKDPYIKVDDWTSLQALPRPGSQEQPTSEVESMASLEETVAWSEIRENFMQIVDEPFEQPVIPSGYCIAIIGAGVAGLRTAMLLQAMGIPYKIFEASSRPGGRIFTYHFPSKSPGNHDYYDAGAMRFPENKANERTFQLFKELNLSSELIEYVFSTGENIRYYNDIKLTAAVASQAGDHFDDEEVPEEYLNKEHIDLRGKTVFGVTACTAAAYDPFRKALIEDFDKGWEELLKYDWASTRSYLARELNYPLSVVHWMESRGSGTGGYDRAFSEAILDSLEFNDPTENVKWWCLEGGSEVFIDAMLNKLSTKPFYDHRVTSVQPESGGIPDLPHIPSMKVKVSGKGEEYFAHVVSTVSFANLRTINTEQVPMTYKQRQAIRTLNYGPAVKVAIRFRNRWWEQDGIKQFGGSSSTDRQSRVVVYPSYGLGEDGPGVLMVTYNWHQDAVRFGALIQNPDWSEQLDPNRKRPSSEEVLLDQIYADLAVLHEVDESMLREETLDYHAFDWYHNPYTIGAFAHFAPGQFSTFFADIVEPAAHGRFHFAGEVASAHHAWVSGALDSAVRVVDEILLWDFPSLHPKLRGEHGRSEVFDSDNSAKEQLICGLFSVELEEAEFE